MRRRAFVREGSLALVSIGLSPAFLRRMVFAEARVRRVSGKVLIVLFQRGAADGLNVVVPHGEPAYYGLRPTIAIPRPSAGGEGALDLDGFFGLHPALAPIKPLYDRGILAPVHAAGSPSSTRSHFDAQHFMETGTPDEASTRDGWINRYLQAVPGGPPFRAVAMAVHTPQALLGPAATVAMANLDDFTVRANGPDAGRLEALYRSGSADLIHSAGAETFDAMKVLHSADPGRYRPAPAANYPSSPFGRALRQIAQLVKLDVGLEVAFTDVGGWDTHVNQGSVTGQLAQRLDDFAKGIAALVTDLGDRMSDVVIVTMSEFGRMAKENGDAGTDHGHAGAMLVLGGPVRGGTVRGRWPGLAREQLFEGRDLALTTDFRAVLSEIVRGHLGAERLDRVFPGFSPPAAGVGVVG
jgi:uncharacterized protein (DUF1501 family)